MNIHQQIKKEKSNWVRARKVGDMVAIKKAAYAIYELEMKIKDDKEKNTRRK